VQRDPKDPFYIFARDNRISILDCVKVDSNPNMTDSKNSDHWRVILKRGSERMILTFSQGHGWDGQEPWIESILHSLQMECAPFMLNARFTFEDWCADCGYDTDSRKAFNTYGACEALAVIFETFIGELADEFFAIEE
jgi:hypothetical protein